MGQTYKVTMTGLQQLNQTVTKLNETSKSLTKVNKSINTLNKDSKKLGNTLINKLGLKDVSDKLQDFKKYLAPVKTGFKEGIESVNIFSKGMSQGLKSNMGFVGAFKNGFKSMTSFITGGSKVMSKALLTVRGALMGFIWPVLAIAAAFVILKRMFTLNVGGMQTQWNKITGGMKKTWAQFKLAFDKVLKAFGPIISGIFKYIGSILKPIIDLFKFIGKEINKIFGGDGQQALKIFSTTLKVIGKTIEIIGKVIGFVLKIAFLPLKGIIIVISFLAKLLADRFKKIGQFIQVFLVEPIKMLVDLIKELFEKIAGSKIGKMLGMGNQNSKSNDKGNKKVTNNNQQITFNTNRPTSPEQTQAFADDISSILMG